MTYKKDIWDQIRENSQLRRKIAMALEIGEAAVTMAARPERQSDSLTKYAAVQILKKELRLTDDELFEPEMVNG